MEKKERKKREVIYTRKYTIRIPEQLFEDLNKFAERNGLGASEVVREAISSVIYKEK